MSRTVTKVRVVKTLDRLLGAGDQESFWLVQEKHGLRWKTVATFGNSTAALVHAKQLAK